MMLPLRSERDRRAVKLGLGLLLPGLLWAYGLAPFARTLEDTGARLETERRLLQGELAMLEEMDRYPPTYKQGIERLVEVQSRLLSGESPGAQSAALTGYVQGQAQRSGVLISRLEPIAGPEAPGGLVSTSVRVTGESDLEGVLSLLRALEGGTTLVHTTQLQLRSAQSTPTALAAGTEVITFEFVATAFALPRLPSGVSAGAPTAPGEAE